MSFKVACIQINSSDDFNQNLAKASDLIDEAASKRANLILTPENVSLMTESGTCYLKNAYLMEEHPALLQFKKKAKQNNIWLLIGSIAIKKNDSSKLFNRSILIDNQGEVVTFYDKIHMFDVTLPNGKEYQESKRFDPGNSAVVVDTPWGKIGLTICYDLRFPNLYRHLAHQGAIFLSVPSAFTYVTGKAHWKTLLQARAIENTCFVFAPAQCGHHPNNRQTFGHSMIIDPWGTILAEASEKNERNYYYTP